MARIIISVPHGAAAGNMMRRGLLSRVLELDPNICAIIASPLVKDPAFVREFEHPRVRFEDLPAHVPAGIEARLLALMQACYLDSAITESVRIRRAEARTNGTIRWVRAKARLGRMIAPSLATARTRYDLSDRLASFPVADRLFDVHEPRAVITSSPGLILSEVPLLAVARRRGTRTIAIDPSWDNFTNKLLPVRRVDRLLVWNDIMREQAVDWHGYAAEEISVCGAPQFDGYFADKGPHPSRDAFCERVGADPRRKLLTLTTTPQSLYSHHARVIRDVSRAIESGAVRHPAQLLVRLHPRDDEHAYRDVRSLPHVIIEKPFRPTVKVADGLAVDVMPEHQRHLAETLRHTDVALNVASTIAIEACVFDTPVVNIAFDGDEPQPFERSARRYYRFTHYVNITRHGAVKVAESPDDLIGAVNDYLADRGLDAEGRRQVVREQCQFLDGRSAERVAAMVARELEQVLELSPVAARNPQTQMV